MTEKDDDSKKPSTGPKASLAQDTYVLRLYVTGNTPKSARAIKNLRRICEDFLHGRYKLEVVDLYQQPELAKDQQIIAAPTLVKELPEPVKRILGDMSNEDRVLAGLDVRRERP